MNIHEYMAKNIFRTCNIKVPESYLARSPEEAYERAQLIGKPVVVKSQVLSGGREKQGESYLQILLKKLKKKQQNYSLKPLRKKK